MKGKEGEKGGEWGVGKRWKREKERG